MFLELERSTYLGIRAYLLILFTLEYSDTHADFTRWCQCANQKLSVLVIETKDSFVSLVTDMNNKSNVCKQGCLL